MLKKGNYLEVIKEANRYLDRNRDEMITPEIYGVIYLKGLAQLWTGKSTSESSYLNEALKTFSILLQQHSDSPNKIDPNKFFVGEIQKNCSSLYYAAGRADEVNCNAAYCLGLVNYIAGNWKSALHYFNGYLDLVHLVSDEKERDSLRYTTIKALHYKGRTHMNLEQHNEAIYTFLSCLKQIEIDGYGRGSYPVLFNIGLSYYRMEFYQDALYYFNEALLHLNNKPLRLDSFEKDLVTVKPENLEYEQDDTRRHVALVYSLLGDTEKAISLNIRIREKYHPRINEMQQTITKDPSKKDSIYRDPLWILFFAVRNNLAMIYADQGDFDSAEREIAFVDDVSLKEKFITDYMVDTKGYVFYKRGQYKKALHYFSEAVDKEAELEGSKRPYWFHKGNCYLKLKKYSKAINCYNNSVSASESIDDKKLHVLNNLAVTYYNGNQKEQAITGFKEILKVKYNYTPAHHNLLKLSASEPKYSSFWNYWKDSNFKKYFATSLIATIFAIIVITLIAPALALYVIHLSGNTLTTTENTTTVFSTIRNNSGAIATNTTTFTNTTRPLVGDPQNAFDIPIYSLITIGILSLILLSPIIRSASIGTTSIELTTVDRAPDKQTELEFMEK